MASAQVISTRLLQGTLFVRGGEKEGKKKKKRKKDGKKRERERERGIRGCCCVKSCRLLEHSKSEFGQRLMRKKERK